MTKCKNVNVSPPRRSVVIEKDSVNSAALNETPQDSHQRMLVAGSVAVSPSGTQPGRGVLAHLEKSDGIQIRVVAVFL